MFFSCVQKKKTCNTHSNIIYLQAEKSEERNVPSHLFSGTIYPHGGRKNTIHCTKALKHPENT